MLVRFTLRIYMLVRFTLRLYMLVRFTLWIYMLVRLTLWIYMLVRFTLWIYMLVRFYIVLHGGVLDCMIYVHELKISLLKSKFESCPVFSYSRAQYLGIVKSSFPASQASCRVSFPPCCSYAEVARVLLTLISPICAWKGKTYRHIGLFGIVFVITRI